VNVLKCILVQKVGFLKYKSGLLHGHKMKMKIDIDVIGKVRCSNADGRMDTSSVLHNDYCHLA